MAAAVGISSRCQLYRLLSEPFRLRLLALSQEEELALGELAELLSESQSNVSRHAAQLRQAGLLSERRHGTRTFVRLSDSSRADPVVVDALSAGRVLCREDGSLSRVSEVVRGRDAGAREFFERPLATSDPSAPATELPAYLHLLRLLIGERGLAVDVGTGDGALLDVLCPIFERVVAVDRSQAQLERAEQRVARRGYRNVELLRAELDDPTLARAVGEGADLVVAARVLHHAVRPAAAIRALSALLRPGGRLWVVDYERHADESFRKQQADVWSGFDGTELCAHAHAAGLAEASIEPLPRGLAGRAPDGHLSWHALTAMRPRSPARPGPKTTRLGDGTGPRIVPGSRRDETRETP